MSRRFVLVTQGTMGDLNPFLGIASGLRDIDPDAEIHILTNEDFKDVVEGRGAQFHPICPKNQAQDVNDGKSHIKHFLAAGYRRSYERISEIHKSAPIDAVVGMSVCRGAEAACEVLGIRFVRICLQPYVISSALRPSYPQRFFTTPPLKVLNPGGFLVKAMNWRDARKIKPVLNEFRQSVGLEPKSDFGDMNGAGAINLGTFPDWFAPRQDDWPRNFRACGFPNFSQFGPGESDLTEFMTAQRKPLVFFPGSGVVSTGAFIDAACEIARALGKPAVIIDKNLQERGARDDLFFENRFCNLRSILTDAGAIFHHGGIGTTSDALRAGIPQFVVPRIYDQLDNGMRLKELGVGDVIYPQFSFAAKHVVPMYNALTSQYQTFSKLERFASNLAEEDKVDTTSRAIFESI